MNERRRFFDVDAVKAEITTGFVSGTDKNNVRPLADMPKDNHEMVKLLLEVYKLGKCDAENKMLDALGLGIYAGEVRRL